MTAYNSVEGLLGHLDDEDDDVIEASLQSLVDLIPYHWSEIADELPKIEGLSEDTEFKNSKLASLLASKIFFHIQSYEDSLTHALCAGELFNVSENSDYVKKLTGSTPYLTFSSLHSYTNKHKTQSNALIHIALINKPNIKIKSTPNPKPMQKRIAMTMMTVTKMRMLISKSVK